MQGLKAAAALLIRRSRAESWRALPNYHYRNLSSLPSNSSIDDDIQNQVLVEGEAYSRAAILNRPSALNALNTNMCARLLKLYKSWEDNPDIGFVMMKGSGRAFCAGGDIVSLYHLIKQGKLEDCKEFFRTIYSFIYELGTYLKPHVAILDGITMGGGAGVSIPGTFRVATDRTVCHRKHNVFATPETLIGFHPDAGASFYLSHLPGHLGILAVAYSLFSPCYFSQVHYAAVEYFMFFERPKMKWLLILDKIKRWASFLLQYLTIFMIIWIKMVIGMALLCLLFDNIVCQLAMLKLGTNCLNGFSEASCLRRLNTSRYVYLEEIGEYLALSGETLSGAEMIACGLATHYSYSERLQLIEQQLGKLVTDDPSVIEATLEKYSDLVHPDKMSVLHSHDTVEEIFYALESEASGSNDAFCNSTLRRLKEASPLSLKVSLRSIREGRFETLDQCLVREYRMSLQGISKNISTDFCEGVRARMVDKDLAPKWNPASLEQVSEDMVEHYFSPLNELEPDLELPTEQREAFT
ncbi:3-hydroxyisobutyryl-CoA hydrolase-like protein 1, mitochondrial isoform X3 [Manihot esculenta]|uniref:3-hydroxyisobutyryl-CoA hydrolase-like protein 1, mitochondrial isoform X3 n=1 Tax=Manihot esculenta TaxID=3983 RepID=UPI000B5D4012|nr:3-hydroxyisobutyryl-CoA hydrolase-like protein 1, mitochondrial isoform X3 [Manihot esculenta]